MKNENLGKWVDFVGGARMKLAGHLAIEVQQGKMPRDRWYWHGIGGISSRKQVGGFRSMEEAKSEAMKHARMELEIALESLPKR
jgi:hypothetical protein